MSNDTTAWSAPTATPSSATNGLIQAAATYASTANNSGNTVRFSAYGNLGAAAADFRRFLEAFDSQADSAVATQITAIVALL